MVKLVNVFVFVVLSYSFVLNDYVHGLNETQNISLKKLLMPS